MSQPILSILRNWFPRQTFARMMSYAIMYKEYGEPNKVLEKTEVDVKSTLENGEVHVKMLASPINPADINMIQGTYALKPKLPAVGGNEGVGEVIKVGEGTKSIQVGSWVIPSHAGWGTWRTEIVCKEDELTEVPNNITVACAATIAVNPCTAYRMLVDFEQLKPGDSLIQNGANSGVGQSVIQIAKHMGLKSINIVRQRPDFDQLKKNLQDLGADFVLAEEELRTPVVETIFKTIPKPKLALNCVGGKATTDMLRHIAHKGSVVTYGGMSRQPVTIPTGILIFKDMKFRGYWMTQWSKDNARSEARKSMFEYIAGLMKSGVLKTPCIKYVPLDDFEAGVKGAMAPYVTQKYLFVMDEKYLKYPYTIDKALG